MKREQIIKILEKEGREITCQTENITIYWDREDSVNALFALQPTELREELYDKEIEDYCKERFSGSHLLPEIVAYRAIKYYLKGFPPISGRLCALDNTNVCTTKDLEDSERKR